jgi:hypothetical protein
VAFELKVRRFVPEDLGKLSFYVEALDRDVKKPNERPSIGVLRCATKDDEVVEFALARTTSPTLVAEYQTMLPPKAVLRRKLHELYTQLAPEEPAAGIRLSPTSPTVRASTSTPFTDNALRAPPATPGERIFATHANSRNTQKSSYSIRARARVFKTLPNRFGQRGHDPATTNVRLGASVDG